jgi:hypothetical protein
VDGREVPPRIREALLELVAYLVNEGSESILFDLKDLATEDRQLGSFEVHVRRS